MKASMGLSGAGWLKRGSGISGRLSGRKAQSSGSTRAPAGSLITVSAALALKAPARMAANRLIDKKEFIAVKQEAAGVGQAVLAGIGDQVLDFIAPWRARKGQSIGPLDLAAQIRAIALQSRGEMFALSQDERVVEGGQSLKRREGDVAFGREQVCVRTIQHFHE